MTKTDPSNRYLYISATPPPLEGQARVLGKTKHLQKWKSPHTTQSYKYYIVHAQVIAGSSRQNHSNCHYCTCVICCKILTRDITLAVWGPAYSDPEYAVHTQHIFADVSRN